MSTTRDFSVIVIWYKPNSHHFAGVSFRYKVVHYGFQSWFNNLETRSNSFQKNKKKTRKLLLFHCFLALWNYLHLEELIRGRLERNTSAVLSPLKTKRELTWKKEIKAQVIAMPENAGMQTKSTCAFWNSLYQVLTSLMWLQVSLNVRIKIEQEQLWKNNHSDLAMLFGTLTFTLKWVLIWSSWIK